MEFNDPLRSHVLRVLDWQDAHVGFDAAVDGVPPHLQGTTPEGLPYSLWQLLEHMRLAQRDILEFCHNPAYVEPAWPDDYWPRTVAPPGPDAWDQSVAAFRRDREALTQLTSRPDVDLFARIPHGTGQTYLREILLVADHNAYHVGQIVLVRRQLGIWRGA